MLRSALQSLTESSMEESRSSNCFLKNISFRMLSARIGFAQDKKYSLFIIIALRNSQLSTCEKRTTTHFPLVNVLLSYLLKKEVAY